MGGETPNARRNKLNDRQLMIMTDSENEGPPPVARAHRFESFAMEEGTSFRTAAFVSSSSPSSSFRLYLHAHMRMARASFGVVSNPRIMRVHALTLALPAFILSMVSVASAANAACAKELGDACDIRTSQAHVQYYDTPKSNKLCDSGCDEAYESRSCQRWVKSGSFPHADLFEARDMLCEPDAQLSRSRDICEHGMKDYCGLSDPRHPEPNKDDFDIHQLCSTACRSTLASAHCRRVEAPDKLVTVGKCIWAEEEERKRKESLARKSEL